MAFALNRDHAGIEPQLLPQQIAESQQHAAAQTHQVAAAQPRAAGPTVAAATEVEPARPGPSASGAGDATSAGVATGNRALAQPPSPEMLERARELRAADAALTPAQGPAEACLNQMKTIFCPIIANMPFVRDVAGQVAIWGNFDCPTGASPKG
jgi:hypothetical protein